jgi:hypothetical protein
LDREREHPYGVIDANTLLAACGGDPGLLGKLALSFRTHIDARLADVHRAMRQCDRDALQKAAHKLIGFVSTFSRRTAEAVEALRMAYAAGNLDQAEDLYRGVEAITGMLRQSLENLSVEDLERLVASKSARSMRDQAF